MVRLVIYIIDTIHVEQTQKYFHIEIGGHLIHLTV